MLCKFLKTSGGRHGAGAAVSARVAAACDGGREMSRGRRRAAAVVRLPAACLLACLLASAAFGYTVVMRGGRRVEIPDAFRLTGATVTYEAAAGINITLPLDHIDIAATERANREPAGSFLRRAREGAAREAQARQDEAAQAAGGATRRAVRTLTNRELEGVRRARVESELSYERRRAELGLPSAEEMRRRDEREAEYLHALALRQAEAEVEEARRRRALAEGMLLPDFYAPRHAGDAWDTYPTDYFAPGTVSIITTDGRFDSRFGGHFGGRFDRRFDRRFDGRRFGGRFGGPHLFPPSVRTSPFAPLHPANLGPRGGRRPRVGASVGVGVSGGTRVVVGGRRGSPGRFSRRK